MKLTLLRRISSIEYYNVKILGQLSLDVSNVSADTASSVFHVVYREMVMYDKWERLLPRNGLVGNQLSKYKFSND